MTALNSLSLSGFCKYPKQRAIQAAVSFVLVRTADTWPCVNALSVPLAALLCNMSLLWSLPNLRRTGPAGLLMPAPASGNEVRSQCRKLEVFGQFMAKAIRDRQVLQYLAGCVFANNCLSFDVGDLNLP